MYDRRQLQFSVGPAGIVLVIALTASATLSARGAAYAATDEPRVILVSPADGGAYALGSWQRAQFSCESDAAPLTQCGAVVDDVTFVDAGAAFPTLAPGIHTIVVTAIDTLGQTTSVTARYTVVDTSTTGPLIRTIAGGGAGGSSTSGNLDSPYGLEVTAAGDLFIADFGHSKIRKVLASTGGISTVAGTGTSGFSGDGGLATQARLSLPISTAHDAAGNLYIADYTNYRVRRVSVATGTIVTVAGNGTFDSSGDGGLAVDASMRYPTSVATDAAGNLYIAEPGSHRVRKVTTLGFISTVAGSGVSGYGGDNGPAVAALLSYPSGVAVDHAGNLYIAESGNHRIRKVAAGTGLITTVAGNGVAGYSGDGGGATAASLNLAYPAHITIDRTGKLVISDAGNNRVRRVDLARATISTVAGTGVAGNTGDGGLATNARLSDCAGVAVDGAGNIYIAMHSDHSIRMVEAATGVIETIVGSALPGVGDGGSPSDANLRAPVEVAADGSGNLFIAEPGHFRVRKLDWRSGLISTVAGNGSPGYSGDGGPATRARFSSVWAVATDRAGHLYVADNEQHRVRRVDAVTGIITTIAGTGTEGASGDGGPATSAQLRRPASVAVDDLGNVFIAEAENARIRMVSAATGIISTVAGTGVRGFNGDGQPGAATQLGLPTGVAVDALGNLFIADFGNCRVRKLAALTGIVSTVAGYGVGGDDGDGDLATRANICAGSVTVDRSGNLYLSDWVNARLRFVDAETGLITTIAGDGTAGFSGDGGPATLARLGQYIQTTAIDPAGNVYVADLYNDRIRRLDLALDADGDGLADLPPVAPVLCRTISVPAMPQPRAGVTGPETLWLPTGVALIGGQVATIAAQGTWTNGTLTTTAAGDSALTMSGPNCPLPGQNALALAGRIGQAGVPFLVGPRLSATATQGGQLFLAPNDNWYTTWDNTGSLDVEICSPNPLASSCAYVLGPPPSGRIPAAGGSGSFTVSTAGTCAWAPIRGAAWVHVISGGGPGAGIVSFSVDANSGAARSGTITVGDQSYLVSQRGPDDDDTPPVVRSVVVGAAGANGWYRSDVTLTWTVTDPDSVVTSTSGCGAISILADAPVTAITCSATSRGGTTTASVQVGRDTVAPTVSVSAPADGTTYSFQVPVTASYTCDDIGGSGVVSCAGSAPNGSTMATSAAGARSFSVVAADAAGNQTTVSVAYTVSRGQPVVTWGAPAAIMAGMPLTAAQLNATASVPGSYEYAPSAGAVLPVGPRQSLSVTFTPSDTANYESVSRSVTIDVEPATCASATALARPPSRGGGGVETLWQSSGIAIEAGRTVSLTATGTWINGGRSFTADGDVGETVTGPNCPLPGQRAMALIGRIGPHGAPFLVGARRMWTPTESGVLYLAPQDNWYTTWDNTGSLSVAACVAGGASCSYSLGPAGSGSLVAVGASGTFSVTTGAACAWSATPSDSWVHVSTGSGPGSGTVGYTVDANAGAARSATIVVADQSFTVSQAAAAGGASCSTLTVAARPPALPGVGGVETLWQATGVTLVTGRAVTVTAVGTWTHGSRTLTADGDDAQTVTGPSCPMSGAPALALVGRVGPTGAPFLVGSQRTFTPAATGMLYLAPQDNWYTTWDNTGDLRVTVCENGVGGSCSYALAPAASDQISAGGGGASFTVTTGGECAWTPASSASWIHVAGGGGPGSGTVTYTVDVNAGAARSSTIQVGSQSYQVTQAAADGALTCTTVTVTPLAAVRPGVGGVETLWQSSGVSLTGGQPATVTATGTWSNGGRLLTAEGDVAQAVTGPNCPSSGTPTLALIGRIGPSGTPFPIGTSKAWTPASGGVLYFAPNDNWYATWDNAGSLSVTVCR